MISVFPEGLNRNNRRLIFACVVFVSIFFSGLSARSQDDPDPSGEAVALFNKGQDAHEKGEFKIAIENYEKAIKLIPEFPEAELQRGNAYQSLGKLDDAERAFRRALELRENWSLALANLGYVLMQKGGYSEASKVLTRAIEADDLNFPAYAAMAELRLRMKAEPKELQMLLLSIRNLTAKANPTAPIWAARAALENALGDRKNARLSAAKALERDPKSISALLISADAALLDSDPTAAEPFVTRLETLYPQIDSTKGLRARILVAQGKNSEAIALLNLVEKPSSEIVDLKREIVAGATVDTTELEKQLAAAPESAVILGKLCTAFRVANPTKALDYCLRASHAEVGNPQPAVGYAAALVQAKRYDEAITVLRKLLAVVPDNVTARANLATALFQLKRYPEAKTEFRWLIDRQPDQAISYYFLAIVHDQLNELPDAAANYQQFLRLADPESSKLEIERVNLRLPELQKQIKEGKGRKRG